MNAIKPESFFSQQWKQEKYQSAIVKGAELKKKEINACGLRKLTFSLLSRLLSFKLLIHIDSLQESW